jgi:hypothetical protein
VSSADRDNARLPARVEALLSEWPLPEKDEQEWEARAQAIQARLLEAQPKTSADLLRPPFPSSAGEDGPDQQRPSSPKLTDIARAVRESKPDHQLTDAARARRDSKPDPNLTEMAKESLSLASQARAAAPELAARVRAAQAAQVSAVATPAPESAGGQAEPPRSQTPLEPTPGNRRAPLYALIGGGLALAAAVALVVRTKSEAPADSFQAQAPAAAPAASAAPSEPPAPLAERGGVNVEDLKPAPESPESKIAEMPRGVSRRAPMYRRDPESPSPRAPKPAPAESQGIAPAEPPLKPADGRTGLPEKPSTGAVQAALGSVIGGARSCVSGQDRPSNATVVFGSDGRVQGVTVGGAATGTPAAACIRSALEKARVHPFAKPTFSASVTIRPN